MAERARNGSAAWIDPTHVLPAYQLLPPSHRARCHRETTASAGWHLALEDGPTPRLLPLSQQIVHVGRDEACELCIEHPSVAPDHAALAVRRASVLLIADAVTGRTFVNGRRVKDRAKLGDYDIVLFGDAMVVVRWLRAPDAHPSRHPPPVTDLARMTL